ncbi:basic 7S globulin-like precursor [Solanum tuberosum]|uniref:Xyloglucanase-specific endoglucanase inhibitor n=1 Tax=Solanum tuberosum TaxID=4113 RepID=H9NKW8_SOLTU|nr:basic 7S globulin-like [Solanum tuberosum]AFF60302.1 xyloglucanase-specific endoglucanase inhibitor [Solanum tuberosum]
MLTFKLSSSSNIYTFFLLFLLLLNISLCSSIVLPTTLILPVTKDSSTLQYITVIGQRTPLIPVNLTVHLGGESLVVDCESGYTSSTYKPARCKSKQCSFAKVKFDACGDYCLTKPKPGCNNNTCHTLVGNPVITTYTFGAELAEDVLAIGTSPIVLVSQPKFIFTCVESYIMKRLAKGVTGIAGFGHNSTISIPNQLASLDSKFTRKFGICLSSSTRSSGVIFIGSSPYYVYNPMIDISKNLIYTPLVGNPMDWLTPMEYHVNVSSIRIAGKDVPLNKTLLSINDQGHGGTRISTTIPFTILHTSIYEVVKTAFINALPKNVTMVDPPMKRFGACFSSKNIRITNVGPDVPVIDFVFHKKSAFWRIYGANSVVQVSKDIMCLAFVGRDQTWEPSIVIGGYQLEENLLVFDLPHKKIGFSSSLKLQQTSCSKYDRASKS